MEKAIDGLSEASRIALETLAVLDPVNWDDLSSLGLDSDGMVPLLDSSLVELQPSSHTVGMAPLVHDFLLRSTEQLRLQAARGELALL